jgi:hypothetical protein
MSSKRERLSERIEQTIWTTSADLAAFVIDVQKSLLGKSNRVLSRAMVQEMVKPVGPGYYGVGFFLYPVDVTFPYFGHNGSSFGFKSEIYAHREKGYGVVILTNGDGGRELIRELKFRIARAYEWDLAR